jgi:hypothetical protein
MPSYLLYQNGDSSKPILPFKGMNLGVGTVIGHFTPWISMVAAQSNTTIRYSSSTSNFKSWKCASVDCPWKVNITFSSKTEMWSVTKAEIVHANCTSKASIHTDTAVTLLKKLYPNESKLTTKLVQGALAENFNIPRLASTSLKRIVSELNATNEESFLEGFFILNLSLGILKFKILKL